MRETKFRGKNVGLGWLYGNYYYGTCFGGKHLIQDPESNYLPWCVEPETVSQFIGLYDKYGNEIYDGDIVQLEEVQDYTDDHYYSDIRQLCGNKIITLVKWMNFTKYSRGIVYYKPPEYRIEDIHIKESHSYNFYSYDGELFSWDELKIIGNKWDNPELLK